MNVLLFSADGLKRMGINTFRKQVLRFGRWIQPGGGGGYLNVTKDFVTSLVANFKAKIPSDRIPVPDGHSEEASKNKGYVIDLEAGIDGLYAIVEFTDSQVADMAATNKIPGVSAAIWDNYINKETGKEYGPALAHLAIVNEPYIKNLKGFESVQLSTGTFGALLFSEAPMKRELSVIIAELLADHSINLSELQTVAAKVPVMEPQVAALGEKVTTLTTQVTALTAENQSLKTKPNEVVSLSEKITVLTAENTKLLGEKNAAELKVKSLEETANKTAVEGIVDKLLSDGKLAPASKAAFIKLGMENRPNFDALVSTLVPIMDFKEHGVNLSDPIGGNLNAQTVTGHIERLSVHLKKK